MNTSKQYGHFVSLLIMLGAMGYVGVYYVHDYVILTWLFNIFAVVFFCIIIGHANTGYWRGILIDSRCKISLSRLQMVCWTVIVLGSVLTAAIFNIVSQELWETPLNIEIPTELYLLMGISVSSMVASPALLSLRENVPDVGQVDALNVSRSMEGLSEIDKTGLKSAVVKNKEFKEAKWQDMFRGEEFANASSVDLAKIQMFLFTAIILFSYASAIAVMFGGAESAITMFPEIDGGLVTLIGISHSAYLMNKTMPQK